MKNKNFSALVVCLAVIVSVFSLSFAGGSSKKQNLSSYGTTAKVQGNLNVFGLLNVGNSGNSSITTGLTNTSGYTQSGSAANTFSGASSFTGTGIGLAVTNNATVGGTLVVSSTTSTAGMTNTGGITQQTRVFTGTGAITMLATDYILLVEKGTPAATAVTLPASPVQGQLVEVMDGKGNANTYNITVSAASGNINGSATYVISTAYGKSWFVYDGTQWLTN